MSVQAIETLPKGWEITTIGERFDSWGGHTPSKANSTYWGDGLPWVSPREVKATRIASSTHSVTQKAVDETGLRVCPVGSVLVVVRSGILAHSLPVAVTDAPVTINQDVKAFFSDEPLLNEWLALFLRSSANALLRSSRREGTTVQSVQFALLKDTLIPIPPHDRRKQIIDGLERALDKQSSVLPHVSAAKHAIESFRQAVLAAACSGRLTADWRETHHGGDSGVDLVTSARSRRQSAAGKRYKEPGVNEHAPKDELPDTWVQASLGLLLTDIKYGTSRRSDYGVEGVPVLRIPNVSSGRLDLTDMKYAAMPDRELRDLALAVDDVLMIRSNGSPQLVGRCCLVSADAAGSAYAGYLMRLRVDSAAIDSTYLAFALASPGVRHQIEMPLRSTSGVNNINTTEVQSLRVAVPPLAEQREIVKRTQTMLSLAHAITVRIDKAAKLIDRGSQAILAKAFRGELIQQQAEVLAQESA